MNDTKLNDQEVKLSQGQKIGKIRTNNRKVGFIFIDDSDKRVVFKDHYLNTALNFDTVRYEITGMNNDGETEGKVLEVVERNKDVFVGQVKEIWNEELKKKVKKFIPDGRGFYPDPEIVNISTKEDIKGKKVVLKFEKWTDPNHEPQMRITKVLGRVGDNETEMQAAVLDKGLMLGFPPEVEAAAQELKKKSPELIAEEMKTRRDMRDSLMFTIDPADAKDFDDALSVVKLENGNYEIGIHIADPAFWVTPGSILDDAAYERATSIYLVDRTIPMLPEVLSNDLCSLNPHEEKLTFSAVFEITPGAEVVNRWFGRTITISDHRFSYVDAQEALDSPAGKHNAELTILSDLAKIMKKAKVANGAIEFESTEVKFQLDEQLFPTAVVPKSRIWTMEIIEEFMLLANREVSRFVSLDDDGENTKNPFIYRIHDKPRQEKVMEAAALLKKMGFETDTDGDGVISSRELNRVLKEHRGTELENFISLAFLRSMKKATYSSKNIGHFGLAFKHYSHFTSPIRRYPDMIAHRLLQRYISGEAVPAKEQDFIEKQAIHSSEMELKAVEAERTSIRFKYTQFFSKRIGEEINVMVFNVLKFGLIVEDLETKAEGMVNVRNMGGDFYEFNDKTLTLKGQKNGRVFKVGDKIKVKVQDVNLESKQISFELIT